MRVTVGGLRIIVREALSAFSAGAWWITPEGDLTELYDGELHIEAAARLLKVDVHDDLENEFVSRGAIRIRNWDGVLYVTISELDSRTLSNLKSALEKIHTIDETYVFIDVTSRFNKIRTNVGEILDSHGWRDLTV